MAQFLQDALKDIQIIDLTRLLPGPLATDILAGYGAVVHKIELQGVRYDTRTIPPFRNGISTLYHQLNHRKKVYQIDHAIKKQMGLLHKLIKEADVFIEQFRPGFLSQFQLGPQHVQSINPDIIYISLTGYGQSGPKSDWPGHDINFMAESGLLDLNRSEDGKPVIPAVQVADIVGGSYQLALQCMAAIIGNKKGAYLDISMVDGLVPLLALPMSQLVGGIDPHQFSMLSGGLVNYNVYQCADDRWIALGALELKFWNTFCDVAQQPSWKRTDIISLQVDQFDKRLVDDLFYSKTVDQWMALNEKKPFCLSPVLGIQELNS